MSNEYYVYMLLEPSNLVPFYIGKGKGRRAFEHQKDLNRASYSNNRKMNILRDIDDRGLTPSIYFLAEDLTSDEAYEIEDHLILKFGRIGIEPNGILTNLAVGRRRSPITPDVAKKISDSKKGFKFTEEHKEKLRQAKRGNSLSIEHKKNIGAALKGRIVSEDTAKAISKAKLGKPCSEEQAQRLRSYNENRVVSDDTKKKMSESRKGTVNSDETRKRISAGRKGWNPSPETRERMSQSAKLRAARRKND